MPPKRKIKIDKEIAKKVPGKKTTDKSAKGKLSKSTGQSSKKTKLETKNARKSLQTIDEAKMSTPVEEDSRKRPSEDSTLSVEEPIKRPPAAAKKLRLTEENPLEKAIEEVVMEGGASSESDNISEHSSKASNESFITNVEKFLEIPQLSDEEGSDYSRDDEPEYLKQQELEEIPDFFDNFGDIPDVEDVSLDLTVDIVKEKPQVIEHDGPIDIGKFVNPLTGESSSSSKESFKEQLEVQEVKQVTRGSRESIEEEEEPLEQGSVDIPIMSDQELEDDGVKLKLADEEDAFNQFLELEVQGPVVLAEEIDVEALARQEAMRLLNLQTYEFVRELIDRAVDKAEYIDPKVVLRQNLDKRKLMKEIKEKLSILEIERRGKQFLNRKCVEYFRRKRSFRPILEDNPKTRNQEIRKYQTAVSGLDKWLIREQEALNLTQNNLVTLTGELEVTKERSSEEISQLEDLIRKTLKRENFDRLQVVVDYSLKKMNMLRKEISKVRFRLIQKQHDMATLVEQLRDLEDLGNGLSMRNFESLQTETQAMGKKVEERNSELSKLRYRCHSDIHRMAHLKEKQEMLHETITFQRLYLEELQLEKQRLREVVFRQKIERSQLRGEMKDISFQSGLLDKPVLMKDYDATVENMEAARKRVNQSKATVNQLYDKIAALENHCDVTNKSISAK